MHHQLESQQRQHIRLEFQQSRLIRTELPISLLAFRVTFIFHISYFISGAIVRVLPFLLLPATLLSQPVGPAQMIDVSADSLVGIQAGGEEIQKLFGNVHIRQGVLLITADRADFYRSRNRAELSGNVRMTQPGMAMTGPRANYDGNTRIATAPSGVTIVEDGATLKAGAGEYEMNSRIAHFRSGVTLQDGKNTLRAGSGDYYSNEARAEFRDNVRVENDSGTITAKQITHWRGTQESYAVGNVLLVARASNARLAGDTLRHRPAEGYTIATGRPKLVQIDTSRSSDSARTIRRDTTIITAMKLESFRGTGDAYVATDSVRFQRGDLEGIAAIARYLPDSNVVALGPGRYAKTTPPDPTRPPDTNAVTGVVKTPPLLARGPFPVVWYERSQLTGDSITVGLQAKKLHSIDVLGRAFAVTEGKIPGRYDQLAGSRLYFDVERDTIRQIRSEEFASSIVFIYDGDDASGVNRQSGDTIVIDFDKGDVTRARVTGRRTRGEGEYFPEQFVEGNLATFRLEGFRLYDRDGSIGVINASTPRQPAIPDPSPPREDSRNRN